MKNLNFLRKIETDLAFCSNYWEFSILPLYFQIEIIKDYHIVFGDPLEISEYFYHFRAIWKDMVKWFEANQFHSIQEKLDKVALRQGLTN
ncbi:MAG: hypothetical protein ACTSRI_15505 [Promethearchaeota archaeon]